MYNDNNSIFTISGLRLIKHCLNTYLGVGLPHAHLLGYPKYSEFVRIKSYVTKTRTLINTMTENGHRNISANEVISKNNYTKFE